MLPTLPVKATKRAVDTVAFLGLNRTDNTQDGEMRDMQNLSAEQFPTLTQRQMRTELEGYTDPTDLFEWDGHLVVVDGMELKYDGVTIGEVNPGKKQFAVVNTKLCIWPDKVYIDLTNNSFGHLDAEVATGTQAGTVTITDDSITATITAIARQAYSTYYCWYNNVVNYISPFYAWYSYGIDRDAVEDCYTEGEGWDMEGLADLQEYKSTISRGMLTPLAAGDIFIPKYDGSYFYPVAGYENGGLLPDTGQYNDAGYYCVLTNKPRYYGDDNDVIITCNVYKTGIGNVLFSGTFKVGDAVNISGTRYGIADAKHRVITAIGDTTNTLTFVEGALNAPIAYYEAVGDIPANLVIRLTKSGSGGFNVYFTPTTMIQEGRVLWVTDSKDYVHVWNPETKREEARYEVGGSAAEAYVYGLTEYDPVDGASVIIGKDVPDLDFICAKDNRLWGVSNDQENEAYNPQTGEIEKFTSRVIYASALGDPSNWWVFQGVDTDSYQVAVGSEGDFTAIVPLDGVCCWKENRLHKILGSYPSEYYMTEYQVDGVAAGCERSCTVVNDVLYYAGRNGVYAYAGSRPQEIGRALGAPLKNAVGGSDGKVWYLSGQKPDGTYELLTYDLTRGLWMREDATKAEAFANAAGTLHFLAGNQGHYDGSTPPVWVHDPNVVMKTGQGADNTLQWYVEFCPYWEMTSSRYASTALRRRYYLRSLLRLEMSAGSKITLQVRHDDGAWKTLLSEDSAVAAVKQIMIPPDRTDKLVLRISGTGTVKLRDMAREYIIGSERP